MKPFRLLPLLIILVYLSACNNPPPKHHDNFAKVNAEIQNNKVHIDYTDTGDGDTTLLFVHGWCINKTYWDNQVSAFNKKYRVVAMDLGGFGKSGKNRDKWDTQAFASDINAVIDQRKLKNVILIGHSMAGDIVLQEALNQPHKVIAVVGVDNFKSVGGTFTSKDKKEFLEAMALMRKDFKKIVVPWFKNDLFSKTTTDAVKKRVLNDVLHADTVVAVASQEQGLYEEAPNLVKLNKKIYLINSDYQPTDTSGLVKNKIPFKLLTVKGTGHFPMIESPKEFNQKLGEVIKDL